VVGLLVTRLQQSDPLPSLPAELILPEGAQAAAVTFGKGWIAVVTQDDRLLIYDKNGVLLQDLKFATKSPD